MSSATVGAKLCRMLTANEVGARCQTRDDAAPAPLTPSASGERMGRSTQKSTDFIVPLRENVEHFMRSRQLTGYLRNRVVAR